MILKKSVLFPLFLRTGGALLVIASVVAATHLIERSVALTQDPPAEEELLDDELLDDDLLGDDLLESDEKVAETGEEDTFLSIEAHEKVFAKSNFPSADECALCHPKQYKEWSVSQHAYSQLSPLMMSMQNAMNVGTSTTNGDFCLRCHAPVGSDIGEPFSASNLDRHPASREGITCVDRKSVV